MRAVTAGELTVLQSAFRRHSIKLEIANAAGSFIDRTSFLLTATFGADVDQPIAEARVKLRRDNGTESLSPFRGDSPLNTGGAAIDAGRAIRISPATTAYGTAPVAGDYKLLFLGVIDSVDFATSTIEVVARDQGGALVDAWIEEVTTYATDAGTPLEDVIQDILDDWGGGVALYTPVSPGFMKTTYDQDKQSVWDAVRTLAGVVGWDIRYLWDDSTSAFRLTLFEPDRTKTAPDWIFTADRYFDVTRLAISREFVRNVIDITYTDSASGDRETATATDSASVARFGRRWMEIEIASDADIDTLVEAQTLADAALSDLAWPIAEQEIELPFFWPVDLGDLGRFLANGVHYDDDMDLAVTGYAHELNNKSERTRVSVRGKPAGFYKDWIRRSHEGATGGELEAAIDLALWNFRETARTEVTITYEWSRGADVTEIWVFEQLVTNDSLATAPDVFEAMTAGLPSRVLPTENIAVFDLPPSGMLRFVQVEPRSAGLQIGPVQRLILTPPGTPPDRILSLSVAVLEDGSVLVPIYVAEEVSSYRYAFNVGPDASTAWPTDAQVEAGTVRSITGFELLTLPAGTVGFNEVIRLRAAAYVTAGGTPASEHGDIAAAEAARLKPALSLEQGVATETATTATHGAIVRDAGSYATSLHYRTVEQGAAPGAWILKTAAPVDGTEYQQTVNLIEKHQVFIEWRLLGLRNGADVVAVLLSPGFDKGRIANVTTLAARLNEDLGTGSVVCNLDSDGSAAKALGRTDRFPTLAELTAATSRSNGTRLLSPTDFGDLLTGLIPGDDCYFGALPYSPTGTAGEPAFVRAVFGTIAPALEAGTTTEGVSTATFGTRVNDPGGQAQFLDVQVRQAGSAWPSSWTRKSSAPANGTEYAETCNISKGHPAQIRFRLSYTLNGQTLFASIESPVFDVGTRADVMSVVITFSSTNVVVVTAIGDYDTRDDGTNPSIVVSVGIGAATSGDPAVGSNHGQILRRSGTTTTSVICTPGLEAFVKVAAYSVAGVRGPVVLFQRVNGEGTSTGSAARFVDVSAKGGSNGTSVTPPNDATNLVSWTTVNTTGGSVLLQQYQYDDGTDVDYSTPIYSEGSLATDAADYPIHLHAYKTGTGSDTYIHYVYKLSLLNASAAVVDTRWTNDVARLLLSAI